VQFFAKTFFVMTSKTKKSKADPFKADEIRAHKKSTDTFLIKWTNYGEESNTWEPRANVLDKEMIAMYEKATQNHWIWQYQEGQRSPGYDSKEAAWNDFDAKAAITVEQGYCTWLNAKEKDAKPQIHFTIARPHADGRPDSLFTYVLDYATLVQTNVKSQRKRQLRRISSV
jgi:hypothetical protein